MTWFQIYAAYGAPVLLFVACFGLVKFERWQRKRRIEKDRSANAMRDLFDKRAA